MKYCIIHIKEIISFQYDYASSFKNGFARVRKKWKYGIIDKTGKEVVECIYDDIQNFNEGLFVVEFDGKFGHGRRLPKCLHPDQSRQ